MFYCKTCKEERGYPEGYMKSVGNCEICGKHTLCNDVHHTHLPEDSPEEPEDYPEVMSEFISDMKSFSHTTQIVVLAHIAEQLSLDVTATAIRDSLKKPKVLNVIKCEICGENTLCNPPYSSNT